MSDEVVKGVVGQDVGGVEGAASLVAEKLVVKGTPEVKAFDPAMIMLIIQILTILVENCPLFKRSPKEVSEAAKNPGFLQQWAVRSQVKKAVFSQDGIDRPSREEKAVWNEHGDALVEAVLEAGADATPESIKKLVDEVFNR